MATGPQRTIFHNRKLILHSKYLNVAVDSLSDFTANGSKVLTVADKFHEYAILSYQAGSSHNPSAPAENLVYTGGVIGNLAPINVVNGQATFKLSKRGIYMFYVSLHHTNLGTCTCTLKVDGVSYNYVKVESSQLVVGQANVGTYIIMYPKDDDVQRDFGFTLNGRDSANAALPQSWDAAGEVTVIRHATF